MAQDTNTYDNRHNEAASVGHMSDSVHKHISKEAAQRFEIFTGAGRRRRWSRQDKLRIVAESFGNHTTVSEVARRHALTVPQLFAWRRMLGEDRRSESEPLRFVPIAAADAAMPAPSLGQMREITIELNGAVVRVPAGVDGATIRSVVQALRAAP